jgi:signal transduction histidine kinase
MAILKTLRARLTGAMAGSLLLAVILFGGAALALVSYELRRSLDSALRTRAQQVAQLAVTDPAVLNAPGALESPVSGRQIAVEVIDSHGAIVDRSLALGARLLPIDPLARRVLSTGATGFEDITNGGRPYRLFVAPIANAGGPAAGGAVLVASDTSDFSLITHRLSFVLLLSGLGAVVLAGLLAAALTWRGLRPLRQLAEAAGEIERTADPAQRLPHADPEDEIGQLTGVLNRMLAALERAGAGERRFLADASHELRTPVTSLLGNVEYAAKHGADEEVLADLREGAVRLARLVDGLLALERAGAPRGAAGDGSEGDVPVDVSALVRAAVADHPDSRVVLGPLDEATVAGEPEALRRAVGNLIENALLHGPQTGQVTVSAVAARGPDAGRVIRVTVADEGPGPDPELAERLFERFWRGPDAGGRPGSGLGLSIVRAIAERHGGRVDVDGATFAIELPVAGVAADESARRAIR